MEKTAIIVPCYNEEKRLDAGAFIRAVSEQPNLSLTFVNDGSTDRTADTIKDLQRANPAQISCIDLSRNVGKAEAVRRGFLAAFDGGFINIGYWDADLATPAESIARFCSILDGTDARMVLGSRVKLLGRRIERRALRHYLGRAFATAASLMLRLPVYDTQCGAKIFKNTPALRAVFKYPFTVSWIFDVEILARFLIIERRSFGGRAAAHWVEYPLEQWTDMKGSNIGLKSYFIGAIDLLKLSAFLYLPVLKERYAKRLLL